MHKLYISLYTNYSFSNHQLKPYSSKMKKTYTLGVLIVLWSTIYAQNSEIKSYPMVGYSTSKEVALWVQTTQKAEVSIQYFQTLKPQKKWHTASKASLPKNFLVTKFIADSVMPGKKYSYEVWINKVKQNFNYPLKFSTPAIWKYQTDAPDFSVACGSGTYINDSLYDREGKPYGGAYEIFAQIANQKPDIMLWLGDNIYLRADEWNSRTGIAYRYTNTRANEGIRTIFASCPNYAIWDDHDAGPNDCDASFWNINQTLDIFKLFWANPSYGIKNIKGAISFFNWSDVDFFLIDNRYYRDPNNLENQNKTMLGKAQKEWLKKALVYSHASFKIIIIGGQFLNTAKNFETYSNHGFKKERNEIINFIDKQKIKNIIFLTGDRHFTELSHFLTQKNKIDIYDFTVSPLSSSPSTSAVRETNKNKEQGSLQIQRNFGILSFNGKKKDRNIILKSFDKTGNLIWEKSILKK